MNKKKFVLYCDQYPMIKKLSDKQAGVLLKAIHAYCGDDRIDPDFYNDAVVDIVFAAHKPFLDKK